MKKNTIKILKRLDKKCPDCGERALILIMKNETRNSVIYSEKYMRCDVCEWEKPYKEKRNYSKFQFDEEG